MAQTPANLADVTKEVWTSDRLEKQFYQHDDFLSRLQRTGKFTIGKKAVVPIHKGRSGGLTTLSSAGGALNPADEQKVDRAEYTVPYHYHQIEIELGAINEAAGGGFSVGNALDLEVTGALDDLRANLTRQVLGNGDSLIAQCTTTTTANEVELLSTGYGYDAIARGWLYPGLIVDIGTTANEVAIADAVSITAVEENSSTPSITISGSTVSTTSSHYVSVANSRSGATAYESTGLRTIAGSTTSAVGGLDPDTAGEEFWKPASVNTDTSLSLAMLLSMQRSVHQKTGKRDGLLLVTSLKQAERLYSLLQNQVRFDSDGDIGAGKVTPKWNGNAILALPEVPDRELYFINPDDLALVTGAKIKKPTWVSSLQGGSSPGMLWKQGYTSFVDALAYPVGLAVTRRNGMAGNISLTAT